MMDYQEQEEVGGSMPQQLGMIFEEDNKTDITAQSLQKDFYNSLSESRLLK
jgi:hypothetical protein